MIENSVWAWRGSFVLSLGSASTKKAEPVLLSLRDGPDTNSYHTSFNAVTYRASSSRRVSCSHTICQLSGRRWSHTKVHPPSNVNKEAQQRNMQKGLVARSASAVRVWRSVSFSATLLAFLVELLKSSVAMQEQMLGGKGFLVIGYLLEKVRTRPSTGPVVLACVRTSVCTMTPFCFF